MEVFMMAQGVWEPIESEGPVDKQKDKMALAAIYQGISEDTLLQLGAKRTAKEAWNMLKIMNQGAEKVKEVRTQTLWREFDALGMSDSETIDDFSGKLTIIVNKLRSLGNIVEDEKVIKKLLRSTSSKFLQIVFAIEEFSDLKTKSIEEVIGSLKAHEEWLLGCGNNSAEIVLITRAEWKAREEESSFKKAQNDNGERGGRGHGRGRGRGRGRYNGDSSRGGDDESKTQKKKYDKSRIKCYYCGQMGHYAVECPSSEWEEKANLIQEEEEEEEVSLLLMETVTLNSPQKEVESLLLMLETCELW
ncbi:uncharacterized protein LOC110608303 [Manihot esculenta]|uniref:uncharacterized protein LOC110608303 n=1 Tax=Manihot esculenta TaxID=3983 RepID=UPI000B5D3852|nr:uncharacterized protein LOC110608303 [Manihot esculenta]